MTMFDKPKSLSSEDVIGDSSSQSSNHLIDLNSVVWGSVGNTDRSDFFRMEISSGSYQLTVWTYENSNGFITYTIQKNPVFVDVVDESGRSVLPYWDTTFVNPIRFSYAGDGPFYIKVSSATLKKVDYVAAIDAVSGSSTLLSRKPTFSIQPLSEFVSEGKSARFQLKTTNLPVGTEVRYVVDVSESDLVGGRAAKEGLVRVDTNGEAIIQTPVLATDGKLEIDEILTVRLDGAQTQVIVEASVKIIDEFGYPILSSDRNNYEEGGSISLLFSNSEYGAGSIIPYEISGVDADDLVSRNLFGNFVLDESRQARLLLAISEDKFTEGFETLTLRVQGTSISLGIQDTSLSPQLNLYMLSTNSVSASEGTTVVFTLSTTNVATGTVVPYTITGVSASDVVGGGLAGSVDVGANGQATIRVPLVADLFSEGPETLTVTAGGQSASVTVVDTSISPLMPTYSLSPSSAGVAEGSVAVFNLVTTNIAAGNSVNYLINGVSEADVVGGILSGSTIVDATGRATISVSIAADGSTEGAETLRVIVSDKTATMTIADTSVNDRSLGGEVSVTGAATNSAGKNESVTGSIQIDKFIYTTSSSSYQVNYSSGRVTVKNTSSGEEDSLTNVERVKFIDKSMAFDIAGNAGKAYRVYKAAFARDPQSGDMSGLGFWISRIDNGMDMVEVAARFIDSPEFRTLYGQNPSNADFLTKVYTNVLGRTPDEGGYGWWLNELNTNPTKTKAKVLADFAESSENQNGVVSLIGNGIQYTEFVA